MWLVLCELDDVAALWAGLQLRSRRADTAIVCAEELGSALRSELRFDRYSAEVRIDLADGRTISSDAVDGVLNRLSRAPKVQVSRAAVDDRAYAQAELDAFHVGWLAALDCPVVNRPRPMGLCGSQRSSLEWTLMASEVGFATDDGARSVGSGHRHDVGFRSVLVIGDAVIEGPASPDGHGVRREHPGRDVTECARRLRERSGDDIIGFTLADGGRNRSAARFVSATSFPDLRVGGRRTVHALVEVLGRRVAVGAER